MKKILAVVTLIVVVLFSCSILSPEVYAESEISVYLNEELLQFDVEPYIKEGRTMVPFRVIFEAMNLDVSWNASNKTVYAKNDTTEIIIEIGESYSYVNGYRRTLDVPAEIVNGRTFVPLRFVAENSGGEVSWDGDTRTVYITYVFDRYNLGDTAYFNEFEFSIESVDITSDGRVITVNGKSNQDGRVMVFEAYDRSKRIASGFSNIKGEEGDKYKFEAVIFASHDFKPEIIIVKTFNSDRKLVKIAEYNL
ncbi:copper amine oxidase N-terminal domain-containing protein [Herbivorax sp. ANBcel31]|uniref:copper amine oxidase N-terminal domain-containing protein n=1 Tax=Herbivorax sp. ANBcel31 TaxID=3069754 RepID=UPI0027B2414C|nr:copper amine oxidase N-terminal domain-containing protein [Herbivorax sp. ANBcel31]MDQ2087654.1 copper amine oxidase N-terminal domain-containing protein [Herbivorax sp. ANBcel31]